jgi:hypothetical protein
MRLPCSLISAVLLASSLGCRAPESKLPPTDALSYGVSHRGGWVSFVVHTDGTAEYKASGGPDGPVEVAGKVTPAELEQVASLLRENDLCGLRSGRDVGVPDEARPSIRVRLGDLDCEVELWDGEYRDNPRAKACLAAVEGLGHTLSERQK